MFLYYLKYLSLSLIIILIFSVQCKKTGKGKMEREFMSFLEEYESQVIPLSRECNLAYFEATTTGDDALYKKWEELEIRLSKLHTDREKFNHLVKIRNSNEIKNPILRRQIEILYNEFLSHQIDEKKLELLIKTQAEIEKKYSTYRANIGGVEYTDNEIEEILKTETDSRKLQAAWEASKRIGREVAKDVLELVKMRNEIARELGFSNFHAMKLKLNEQDPERIKELFDELDNMTRDAFIEQKKEIDQFLANRYQIKISELRPWHYQDRFFQEAPKIYKVDLDKYYRDKDIIKITEEYYAGIGLPIKDLIEKSDLFEREGKYQHAYCTDIDRQGDVRVVCNIKPNYNWMSTMLHEFGHAVYDKFTDRQLPWLLREPAHIFTTEAIAILFGRFAASPAWLRDVLGISEKEVAQMADECYKSLRLEKLVFSRWAQVMYRFEKSMYENPDQNLNQLWWDLVEKYQMLTKPAGRDEPDWASKIHIALYPAYYHNYLLGELLASQIYYYIVKEILKGDPAKDYSFHRKQEVGRYLRDAIFKPGKKYFWNDMIKKATGEELTAKYFALQFVKGK